MNREEKYHNGYKDKILEELEKQGIDVLEYLTGINVPVADISINGKKYKIFQIKQLFDLKFRIKEFEKEKLTKEIIKKYEKDGVQINKVIGGWKTINKEISDEVEKIYNFVIQKYKLKEIIKKQGFVDLVYNKNSYKIAPKKVGRPTEKEKDIRLNARVTEKQYQNLKEYAEKKNISISEALRAILDYI